MCICTLYFTESTRTEMRQRLKQGHRGTAPSHRLIYLNQPLCENPCRPVYTKVKLEKGGRRGSEEFQRQDRSGFKLAKARRASKHGVGPLMTRQHRAEGLEAHSCPITRVWLVGCLPSHKNGPCSSCPQEAAGVSHASVSAARV